MQINGHEKDVGSKCSPGGQELGRKELVKKECVKSTVFDRANIEVGGFLYTACKMSYLYGV